MKTLGQALCQEGHTNDGTWQCSTGNPLGKVQSPGAIVIFGMNRGPLRFDGRGTGLPLLSEAPPVTPIQRIVFLFKWSLRLLLYHIFLTAGAPLCLPATFLPGPSVRMNNYLSIHGMNSIVCLGELPRPPWQLSSRECTYYFMTPILHPHNQSTESGPWIKKSSPLLRSLWRMCMTGPLSAVPEGDT